MLLNLIKLETMFLKNEPFVEKGCRVMEEKKAV